jgi:hypothetical protein
MIALTMLRRFLAAESGLCFAGRRGAYRRRLRDGARGWRRAQFSGTADGGTGLPAGSITQGDVGPRSGIAQAILADARARAVQQEYLALILPLSRR